MQTTAVRKGRGKKTAFRVLTHLVLILCSITMLIPFLWMISSSLKDLDELFAVPPVWIPKHIAWENYVYMFEQAPWVTYFANTTLVTAAIILGQLVTCSMAAYAFARLKFKGREVIFIIYLGTMMIPFQVVMIPQFQIIKTLGLIDNIWSLIVIGIFNAFGTFLLRQFFLTLPKELEEAAMIDGSITMLIPFLWMISSSLKDLDELFAVPPVWIPKHIAWENYVYMFEQAPWVTYFANTTLVTAAIILGQLVTCSMAAYAFARLKFKGREVIFIIYLGTMMIPFQVVMIPQFQIIKTLGLIDNIWSLIVIGIFNAFGTFLLRQFFLTLPKELEEAAMIDGCSYPRIFWEIIIKNSKPALMTLVIFTFMNTWNDFLRPLIFLNSQENWTLSMGLAKFQGTYVTQWNQMMAGALITMLPILVVYIFAQKYFVQGIVMSGIKD